MQLHCVYWGRGQLLVCIMGLALNASGCRATNAMTMGPALLLANASIPYDSVDLQVIDQETRGAIADAEVEVVYRGGSWAGKPERFLGKTDSNGHIRLRLARWTGSELRVSAYKYAPSVGGWPLPPPKKLTIWLTRRVLTTTRSSG